jgi:molybdate transport system ATP-binding protein
MLEMDVELKVKQFTLSAQLAIDAPITALFGPAGAGKSTLLQMITGTMNAQQGWIKFAGETLFDSRQGIRLPARRRRIGLVSGDPTAYPLRPVKTHLQDAYTYRPKGADAIGFDEVVDLLGIEPLLDKHSHELSAAEKPRAALAHTLMASPRLLLVDDYAKSPGQEFTDEYLALLSRVGEKLGLPIVYVPRSLEEALRLTRRMVFIAHGKILGAGDIADIVNERILLAATAPQSIENTLPVTILDHDAGHGCTLAYYRGTELVLPIAPVLAKGESTLVSIRSSEIALSRKRLAGISIQNQIKGRICAIIRTPEYAMVQVDCGHALLAAVSLRALDDMDLREGDTVYCLAKAQAFTYAGEKNRLSPADFHAQPRTAIH